MRLLARCFLSTRGNRKSLLTALVNKFSPPEKICAYCETAVSNPKIWFHVDSCFDGSKISGLRLLSPERRVICSSDLEAFEQGGLREPVF